MFGGSTLISLDEVTTNHDSSRCKGVFLDSPDEIIRPDSHPLALNDPNGESE